MEEGAAHQGVEALPSSLSNGASEEHGLQHLLRALQAMRTGDFSVRMASDAHRA